MGNCCTTDSSRPTGSLRPNTEKLGSSPPSNSLEISCFSMKLKEYQSDIPIEPLGNFYIEIEILNNLNIKQSEKTYTILNTINSTWNWSHKFSKVSFLKCQTWSVCKK